MSEYRQSSCSAKSADKRYLGGGFNPGAGTSSVGLMHATTTPTPVPLPGDRNGGGTCDCVEEWNTVASGSRWGHSWWTYATGCAYTPIDLFDVQTWTSSGTSQSFGGCGDVEVGFKRIAAKRQWHGTFGLLENDTCAQDRAIAASQVKYRTVNFSCNYSNITWNGAYTGDCNLVRTVDGDSGVITQTGDINEKAIVSASMGPYSGSTYVNFDLVNGEGDYLDVFGFSASIHFGAVYPPGGSIYGCGAGWFLDDINASLNCEGNDVPTVNNWLLEWNNFLAFYGSTSSYAKPTGSAANQFNISSSITLHDYGLTPPAVATSDFSLTVTKSNTDYIWSITVHYRNDPTNPSEFLPLTNTKTFSGMMSLTDANEAGALLADCESLLGNWDLGDDKVHPYRTDNFAMFMPLVSRREVQTNRSPMGFATYGTTFDYSTPVADRHGNAAFTSNENPPPLGWTYNPDNNDSEGRPYTDPGWSGAISWEPFYAVRDWFDNANYWWNMTRISGSVFEYGACALETGSFDGAIIGKPFLFSGSLNNIKQNLNSYNAIGWGWFDWYFQDIRYCEKPADAPECFGIPWLQYTYRYGGTLADAEISTSGVQGGQLSNILPLATTHWVNNYQAHGITQKGAMLNSDIDTGIWAIKYAELRTPTPSYNYFRPCGYDRTLIDETTAQTFITDDLIMEGSLAGVSGQILLTFTNGFDGIYTGSSETDNMDGTFTLTLGTKVCDLPAGYFHAFQEQFEDNDVLENFGLVGAVRFPNAWAICGRESITLSEYPGTGSWVHFNNPQYNLRQGDFITLYNSNMSYSSSNYVWSGSDASTFYVGHAYAGQFTSSIYAMSMGAPSYQWNDITPKYEYRTGIWNTSHRSGSFDYSSSCVTSCVDSSPCGPSVVLFSPNAESFTINYKKSWFGSEVSASATSSMSGSWAPDGLFGNYLSQNVEFTMTDLLYQVPKCPHAPYLITLNCAVDPGTCPDDTIDPETGAITAHSPPAGMFEARCDYPAGAPTASGVVFPIMAKPEISGNPGYDFNVYQQPWNTYANMQVVCADTASTCRFLRFYNCS